MTGRCFFVRVHHFKKVRFFHFWGLIPRAPNFAEFHARGGGGRLPVMSRDLIPPGGAHFSTAKRESLPRQSGLSSEKAGLGGANGLAFGRLAAATGGATGLAGEVSAEAGLPSGRSAGGRRRAAEKRALAGAEAAHAGAPGGLGCARVPGARAKRGASRGFFRARRAKTGPRRGQKGRLGGLKGRVRRVLGAKKPTFAAKRAGNGAVLGRKLAEKAGGA